MGKAVPMDGLSPKYVCRAGMRGDLSTAERDQKLKIRPVCGTGLRPPAPPAARRRWLPAKAALPGCPRQPDRVCRQGRLSRRSGPSDAPPQASPAGPRGGETGFPVLLREARIRFRGIALIRRGLPISRKGLNRIIQIRLSFRACGRGLPRFRGGGIPVRWGLTAISSFRRYVVFRRSAPAAGLPPAKSDAVPSVHAAHSAVVHGAHIGDGDGRGVYQSAGVLVLTLLGGGNGPLQLSPDALRRRRQNCSRVSMPVSNSS